MWDFLMKIKPLWRVLCTPLHAPAYRADFGSEILLFVFWDVPPMGKVGSKHSCSIQKTASEILIYAGLYFYFLQCMQSLKVSQCLHAWENTNVNRFTNYEK